ncbi:hypothetical protein N7E81_16860 [Reichenbachiella carrageenanivorans]|uniref:DUF3185 family protein n=1 Tax=Reichenbachiella carrageenanivorans TaxID=2979869 RepID=A0ABY6CYP6_9BACT|nr:hypothetical protein [Reichenbachiella carrageenanivorans]UXX79027.1 hypothetical protein N7E81_16860 [Reichenbachiella carrageenanivorans]
MKNIKSGILYLLIGGFFVYWAETHSPKKLGQAIGNVFSGSYTMDETSYYICLGLGIAIGLLGLFKILKK